MNAATPRSSKLPVDSSSASPSTIGPLLAALLRLEINRSIILYIVHCLIETVDYALDRPCTSSFNGRPIFCQVKYGPLTEFVSKMVYRSKIKIPVILVTLAYISRAKTHLKITLEPWACVRVFMGAIVLAGKYSSDFVMKNSNWAQWSGLFRARDIGRMERELLNVLDWDLTIREGDILEHHEFLSAPSYPSFPIYQPSIFIPTTVSTPTKRRRSPSSPSFSFPASRSSIISTLSSSPSYSSSASGPTSSSSSSSSSPSQPLPTPASSLYQRTPTMQSQHQYMKVKCESGRPLKRMRLPESFIPSISRYPPLVNPSSFVKDVDYNHMSPLFRP